MFDRRSLKFAALAIILLAQPALAENAVPVEKNPPGDIPDSQVFVDYQGPNFSMKIPEGWSRTDETGGAKFSDKFNIIDATSADAAAAPTIDAVVHTIAPQLASAGRAVKIGSIKQVNLTVGPAIRIDYSTNSEPNAVTNKQIRLEEVRFLIFKSGKLVTLDMAAPYGADNVDQWNLMANSIQVQ